jgi:glucose-1-phosphatase
MITAFWSNDMNPTRRPEFVYFDLGNVLVHFDHDIAARNISRMVGVSPEQARRIVFGSGLQNEYETGTLSSEAFVRELELAFDKPLDKEATLEAISAIFQPNQAILESLRWLRERGFRMGVLSNTCEAHWQWVKRQGYQVLDGWFEVDVLSFEVGAMKPDLKIYDEASRLAQVAPDAIFFTDDRADNIAGAVQAGWNARQFVHANDLLQHLMQWDHGK